MTIQIEPDDGCTRVRISAELNIYAVAAVRDALLAQAGVRGARRFDLSDVSEIDTAGLQLLLAALRPTAAGEPAATLAACSAEVRACLQLCGLNHLLPGER